MAIALDNWQAIAAWTLTPQFTWVCAGLAVAILLTLCVCLAIAYMPLDPDKLLDPNDYCADDCRDPTKE